MRFVQTWQAARLTQIEPLNHDVTALTISPCEGAVKPYAPGSHLSIAVEIKGRPDIRSYSLVGRGDGKAYQVAVKHHAQSRGGSRYLSHLQPGALLQITDPQTLFSTDYDRDDYLLVAGGIGITPLISFAEALKARKARLRLAYCVRSRQDLLFLDRLQSLLGDDLTLHVSDENSRLDLKKAISTLSPTGMMLICAPLPMIEAARKLWSAADRPPSDLRFETFGTAGSAPNTPFQVRLGTNGPVIEIPEEASLLDTLTLSGVPVISDCRRGECGVCAVTLLEVDGEVDHRDVFLSPTQKQSGEKICLCVSRARGIVTIDTHYRPQL